MTLINKTTVNTRLTIIFDAAENTLNLDDGPRLGVGNTEADIFIDEDENQINYFNIRGHVEIPSDLHTLHWNVINNSGVYEYIDDRENLDITEIPSWCTTIIIRCEAEDKYMEAFNNNLTDQLTVWLNAGNEEEDFIADFNIAKTSGNTARSSYLLNYGLNH
tara:strand:- start:2921 stop:3406 length:486 start_codon:yes stop_codon:yes gene_type:complete